MGVALTGADHQPRVVVLMSTYAGERFIAEQLESILAQLPANGLLMVRDDGSPDGTVRAVQACGDERIQLTEGKNLGFGASFLSLLMQAPADADLVLFADQDDVWLPGKLDRAWQSLAPMGSTPGLYGGAKQLVDEALRPLGVSPPWPRPPSFQNALVENVITGCTAAINRAALNLLQRAGVAEGVYFHDWWLYLVISAHGRVVFDDTPMLLYRQHGANQIGQGAGFVARQAGMVQFLLRRDWAGILLAQVAALMRHYEASLSTEQLALVLQHFHLHENRALPRWRMLLGLHRWRQFLAHEAALRLLLLLRRLQVWPPSARRV